MASAPLAAKGQNFTGENGRSNSHNAPTVHAKELWFDIWSATWITLWTHAPKFEAQLWREAHIHTADVETCSLHIQTRCWPGEVFPTHSTLDEGGCCHYVYPLRNSKEQQYKPVSTTGLCEHSFLQPFFHDKHATSHMTSVQRHSHDEPAQIYRRTCLMKMHWTLWELLHPFQGVWAQTHCPQE